MIRHGERGLCSICIVPLHGDMVALPDHNKAQQLKRADYPLPARVAGEFHLYDDLGDPCVDDIFFLERVLAECLDMESYCRGYVSNGLLIGTAFTDYSPLHADRVCDIPVGMFFHDDLDGSHQGSLSTHEYRRGIRPLLSLAGGIFITIC